MIVLCSSHAHVLYFSTFTSETDGNISIVSKVPIPRQLVSVSVSIQGFLESRYQYRYRSRGLSIFWKVLAEFLLSKISVSVSVPVHFHGISISIGLDSGPQKVSVSVSSRKIQSRLSLGLSLTDICENWARLGMRSFAHACWEHR